MGQIMSLFKNRKLKLTISEPCQENWEAMAGTERERFCEKCQSSVIDFSALTAKQARRVMETAEGRVCGQVVRDPQGNVVFRSEPNGAGRAIRAAGLSLAAISGVAAQSSCELKVQVTDATGAAVVKAKVVTKPGQAAGQTDNTGTFTTAVAPGKYAIEVESPGFTKLKKADIEVGCKEGKPVVVQASIKVGILGEVIVVEPMPIRLRH